MAGKLKQQSNAFIELLKSVQFQKRHLAFWILITLFAGGLFFIATHSDALFASIPEIDESIDDGSKPLIVDIAVSKTGLVLVNGQKTSRIFKPLPNFDELNYKILDQPGTFIDQVIVQVVFEEALPKDTAIRSFAVHGIGQASEQKIDDHTIEYTAASLGPEATYTINAKLPKGSIDWPLWQQVGALINGLPVVFWVLLAAALPIFALITLFFMFNGHLKNMFAGAPVGVITQPPGNLPPAIVGILVNGRVSSREIAATILDLANRGYLTVFNKGKGRFSFAKRKPWQGLRSFELLLLMQMFELSDDKKNYKTSNQEIEVSLGSSLFSRRIAKVYLAMYDAATSEGYFERDPAAVHQHYRLVGLSLVLIGLVAFIGCLVSDVSPSYILFFFAGLMTMALVIVFAATSVPLLTPKGEAARAQWLQFRNYLALAQPIGYVEGAQAFYEKYLPFAVILKSEIAWAGRFRNFPFQMPDWYDTTEQTVAIEDFANGLYTIVGSVAELFANSKEPTVQ